MHGLAEIRRANATKPTFAKRHFNVVADAIAVTAALPHDTPREALRDLVEGLVERFKADNTEFQPQRFREACGIDLNGFDHRAR